jgi:DNA-binding LacI/PurR family transcriptional regulator
MIDLSMDIHQQIRSLIQKQPGLRLPSERALAARFGISRPRLRIILADLRREGLLEQRPGSGTYAISHASPMQHILLMIDADLKLGEDPFFSHLVDYLQAAIQAAGARCGIERIRPGDPPQQITEEGVMTLGLAGQEILSRPSPSGPPIVGLLLPPGCRPGLRSSIFTLEDYAAGQTAAEFLISTGCRSLFFAGRQDMPTSRERLRGAEAAAQEAGVTFEYQECHLNYSAGVAFGRTVTVLEETTGIIAANDWLAIGIRAGLISRTDLKAQKAPIISFDGLPITEDSSLNIHSLAVPLAAIADDAVAELVRLSRFPITPGRLVCYPLTLKNQYSRELARESPDGKIRLP